MKVLLRKKNKLGMIDKQKINNKLSVLKMHIGDVCIYDSNMSECNVDTSKVTGNTNTKNIENEIDKSEMYINKSNIFKYNTNKTIHSVFEYSTVNKSEAYTKKQKVMNKVETCIDVSERNIGTSKIVNRKYSYVVFFVIAFLLSGCSENVINRGYDVATVDFTTIQPDKDTPETVWKKFGSPTTISSVIHPNGDYCWYYSSKNMTKSGFLKPTLKSTKLWIITFDKNHKVKSVKLNDKEYKINMKSETSKSDGKTKGIGKELFGGAGRYIHKFDK